MKVDGLMKMLIVLNVYDLETEAVEGDGCGKARVTDIEQFFIDWVDAWNDGSGELLGAEEISADLSIAVEED